MFRQILTASVAFALMTSFASAQDEQTTSSTHSTASVTKTVGNHKTPAESYEYSTESTTVKVPVAPPPVTVEKSTTTTTTALPTPIVESTRTTTSSTTEH
jgi:hypothetical protein